MILEKLFVFGECVTYREAFFDDTWTRFTGPPENTFFKTISSLEKTTKAFFKFEITLKLPQ